MYMATSGDSRVRLKREKSRMSATTTITNWDVPCASASAARNCLCIGVPHNYEPAAAEHEVGLGRVGRGVENSGLAGRQRALRLVEDEARLGFALRVDGGRSGLMLVAHFDLAAHRRRGRGNRDPVDLAHTRLAPIQF